LPGQAFRHKPVDAWLRALNLGLVRADWVDRVESQATLSDKVSDREVDSHGVVFILRVRVQVEPLAERGHDSRRLREIESFRTSHNGGCLPARD